MHLLLLNNRLGGLSFPPMKSRVGSYATITFCMNQCQETEVKDHVLLRVRYAFCSLLVEDAQTVPAAPEIKPNQQSTLLG